MISIEFVVSNYINRRFVVSVEIGQEFKRPGRCNLVVCGFSSSGKIQTYQKILVHGWKIRRIFKKEVWIEPGVTLEFPNGKKREVIGHCGTDWYVRIPGEILEFTEEQLIDFDASAEIDREISRIVGNSPNNIHVSRPKNKNFSRCRKMASMEN
jgi:hypothetical protein